MEFGCNLIEMVNEDPLFYQLSVEVFSIMMKNTPHHYLDQLPITIDNNLNNFIRCCLTINWRQRPTIKQLLQSLFILQGPEHKNSHSTGLFAYLDNREKDAQIHANSIINANLHLWLTAGINVKDIKSITPPLPSETDTFRVKN